MKQYLLLTIVGLLVSVPWTSKNDNNVCKTFDDYYSDRDANENCYYNPDVELTVPEIIQRNGYPIETYEVVTSDGYILTVFRIPHGKKSSDTGERGKPIFLQHGTNSNSGCFVNIGSKSLAFILADEGYDVWLGNSRGSKYSLNHMNLNHTTDSEYWDFTLHEYGIDLYAEINMVYGITEQKIIYLGYSLGTTIMYVYCSSYPETAHDKVKLFVNLAPTAYVGEEYFTVPKLASLVWDYVEPIIRIAFNGVIVSPYLVPVEVLKYLCLPFPFQMKFCLFPHSFILGSNFKNNDPETLPITLIHNCDKSSLKLWTHYAQMWYKQTFAQFDYGKEVNLKTYGTKTPPDYNLTKVSVPMYFISAKSDLLTTEADTLKLYKALPEHNKPIGSHIVKEGYGHLDLILAKEVVSVVFDQIVNVVNSMP